MPTILCSQLRCMKEQEEVRVKRGGGGIAQVRGGSVKMKMKQSKVWGGGGKVGRRGSGERS